MEDNEKNDSRHNRFGHPEDGTDIAHYDENGKRIHGDFQEYLREKKAAREATEGGQYPNP